MSLSPPTTVVFVVSIILAALAIIGAFVPIAFITQNGFWVLVAASEDHIRDHGDPETVLGDKRNRHERADDGQRRQNNRNHEDDGCRW